jgi:hypothetical protein
MNVNKLAGVCFIILGVVNALHEFVVRSAGRGEPGFGYAVVTALFFTFGVVLVLRRSIANSKLSQKATHLQSSAIESKTLKEEVHEERTAARA